MNFRTTELFRRSIAIDLKTVCLLVLLTVVPYGPSQADPHTMLAYSDFIGEVDRSRVSDVTMSDTLISGHFTDGRAFHVGFTAGLWDYTTRRLIEKNVRISLVSLGSNSGEGSASILGVLISWFPAFLYTIVFCWLWRRSIHMQGRLVQEVARLADRVSAPPPPV